MFYETVLAGLADKARDGKLAANWVINELFGRLNKEGRDITGSPVSAAQLAAIVDLIGEGTISGKIAKDLFEIVWTEGGDPRELVEARGMKQVTDLGAIEKVVDDIIAANPDKVAQAKAKPQLAGWFVGQVMKSVRRQGQPASGQRSPEGEARHLNCPVTGRLQSSVTSRSMRASAHRSFIAIRKFTIATASARPNRWSRFVRKIRFWRASDATSSAVTMKIFLLPKFATQSSCSAAFSTASLSRDDIDRSSIVRS